MAYATPINRPGVRGRSDGTIISSHSALLSHLSPLSEEWIIFSGSSAAAEAQTHKSQAPNGREELDGADKSSASDLLDAFGEDEMVLPGHDGLGAFNVSTYSDTHARIHAWRIEQSAHVLAEIQKLSSGQMSQLVEESLLERLLRKIFGLDHQLLSLLTGHTYIDPVDLISKVESELYPLAQQHYEAAASMERDSNNLLSSDYGLFHQAPSPSTSREFDDGSVEYWEKEIDLPMVWSYIKTRLTRRQPVARRPKSSRRSCGAQSRSAHRPRNYWNPRSCSSITGPNLIMGDWGSV